MYPSRYDTVIPSSIRLNEDECNIMPTKDTTDIARDPSDFSDLTSKQRRLVENYIAGDSKEKAAIKAGYSKRSAWTLAYREFKNDRVYAYYCYKIAEITEKNDKKIALVIDQLTRMASADMRDFVDKDGNLLPLDKVDGRVIQSVKHTKDGINISLCSREKAAELLGKYLALYQDKVDVTSNGEAVSNVNITFQEVIKDGTEECGSTSEEKP